MNINEKGRKIIKSFEGCHLTVYEDIVGVKTVGYGHTGEDVNRLKVGDTITRDMAERWLESDIRVAEKIASVYDYDFTENEFSALVSFAFNIGTLKQLTKDGTRTKAEISSHILAYCNAGGKRVEGLYNRRKAEKELYDTKEG